MNIQNIHINPYQTNATHHPSLLSNLPPTSKKQGYFTAEKKKKQHLQQE